MRIPLNITKVAAVTYEKTHQWISFKLNLKLDDYRFWLQLGEISSKCEHLSGVPLQPKFAEELHRIFLAKGVLATTAIEGNTLTEEQVRKQVDSELELPPSQEYLKQEIENIIRVCNEEVDAHLNDSKIDPSLCAELIKNYNQEILHNLDVDDNVVPGHLRNHSVIVGNVYRGAPAQDCPYLLERLCSWLNGPDFQPPSKDLAIPFALVRAIVSHVYLAWIHPFGDGNGRTARLIEFHILFSSGLPLPAAHLLSDHYNLTRTMYYRELDRASKSGGDLMPFLKYALQGFLDGIRNQIGLVRTHQMKVAWQNYVHQQFGQKKNSPTQKRRRDLVIELSFHDWVASSEIEKISTTLAIAYLNAGDRMLERDLRAVADMGLIERKRGQVRANKSLIQAFLPARVRQRKKKTKSTK